MPMRLNEVSCLKKCAGQLDESTVAIICLMYHTANRKENPEDKSFYRYEVLVEKIDNVKKMIAEMNSAENKFETWKWKNPSWNKDFYMEYNKFNDNAHGAKFFKNCILKILPWDSFVKKIRDGISYVALDKREKCVPSSKYPVEGYEDADGNKELSIIDKDVLMNHCGKFMWKNIPLKKYVD